MRAPRPPEGRARARRTRCAPVAARLGELLGQAGRVRDRHGRRVRAARRVAGARPTARSRCWRTSASTPGETSKDDAERGAFADQLAALGRRVRRRRLRRRCTASRPASTTSRSGCRTPRAAWSPPRSTCCGGSPTTPSGPYVVVLGGSKVSDKLGVIDNLLGKADRLLIGGGMVFTFLEAQGHEVGKSLLEDDQIDTCPRLPRAAPRSRRRDRAADRRRGRAASSPADATRPRSSPPTRSRPTSSAWTSARSPARLFAAALADAQDGRSGTARWASSRSRRSPTAPGPSPRRSPRSTASPSSAAATPPRPCARSASTRPRSATSRPAAARASSTSRARTCPASPSLED